jgi:hypothetical protein
MNGKTACAFKLLFSPVHLVTSERKENGKQSYSMHEDKKSKRVLKGSHLLIDEAKVVLVLLPV